MIKCPKAQTIQGRKVALSPAATPCYLGSPVTASACPGCEAQLSLVHDLLLGDAVCLHSPPLLLLSLPGSICLPQLDPRGNPKGLDDGAMDRIPDGPARAE